MKIDRVTSTNKNTKKRPVINAMNTGYIAAGGIGLSMISGHSKVKFLKKNHKVFAGMTCAAVLAHMYVILGGPRIKRRK